MKTVQEYIVFLVMLIAGIVGYTMLSWMREANPPFNRMMIYAVMAFWISLVLHLGILLVSI